ncbi:MAG: VWA domain-containing protein [Deltaproteobacteria bacterium]|jgi:serine/threonine-protein kinase PpkA|nr:VWA domain-containing protein [Deltaproteobacteria bacterium]
MRHLEAPKAALAVALSAALLAALALFSPEVAIAQDSPRPLIMEGKKTLFQRVIAHPGAEPMDGPGGASASASVGEVKPFTVLYVYDRQEKNGRQWLQCGKGTRGRDLFWLRDGHFSDWKQSMVLLFGEKAGRQQLLFFRKKSDILDIASSSGIRDALDSLARRFMEYRDRKEAPPMSYPVVAMEPSDEEGAVPNDNFYIMPIFNHDDLEGVKLLDVGSINPGNEPAKPEPEPAKPDEPQQVAICFVIDSTRSMGPYIKATRDFIRNFYDSIRESGNAANTHLAFVTFRSSPEAAPGTEYRTRRVSEFKDADKSTEILAAIADVEQAVASTHAFNEDSIAGINEALALDWKKFNGGVVILVTDAGPLPIDDPYVATRDTPQTVKENAGLKNVRLAVIHLLTPEGKDNKDHGYALEKYGELVVELAGTKLYIPIPIDSVDAGPAAFARHQSLLVTTLEKAARGQIPVTPEEAANPKMEETEEERTQKLGALLGYSVYLDYLGTQNKAVAPAVVRSWISDKDLAYLDSETPRDVRTVKVAVLLTKSQLSSLNQAVNSIAEGASDMLTGNSRNLFDAILSAALKAGRDPNELTTNTAMLSETGLLGEYLDGLPYLSRVMSLNQEVWDSWTPGRQRELLLELDAKLEVYKKIDADVDNWLKEGMDFDGDWLYRVPLTALP